MNNTYIIIIIIITIDKHAPLSGKLIYKSIFIAWFYTIFKFLIFGIFNDFTIKT